MVSSEERPEESSDGDLEEKIDAPSQIKAKSTEPHNNRFRIPLYLRVMPNRTIRPVERKGLAHYTVILELEYPTYEEELTAKKEATKFDQYHSVHYVDQDYISYWRLRRCLIRWNMHEIIPDFTKRIIRNSGILSDDSIQVVNILPPLIRKMIISLINDAMGPP